MLNSRTLFVAAILGVLICVLVANTWLTTTAEETPIRFQPPDRQARIQAIGPTNRLSRNLQRAFAASESFDPIPAPGPSDWLANHKESGQSFAQFMADRPHRPNQARNKLYLQPLGSFDSEGSPSLDKIQAFAAAFFQLPVEILPPVALEGLPIKSRMRRSGHRQLLSTDVLTWCRGRLESDAYCLLAITMEDLYPDERWNFVFGQASLNQRVGVYSFARYLPSFHGADDSDNDESLVLLRSCKVLAHETGHMFGLKHCIHFHCLLNGSNHLEESDQQPSHLCPVCLRKLQSSIGFDIAKRYEQIHQIAKAAEWNVERDWLSGRMKEISD